MAGQKITIEVHDKQTEPRKKVEIKESSKRKDHYKKYSRKFTGECKDLGLNLYKVLVNLMYVFLYGFTALGDLILIWSGNKKKPAEKDSKPKKNLLDEGW